MLLLNRLPARLHRTLYRLAHFLRRIVWRLRRPHVEGVRVLAFDPLGWVLLVRHSYGPGRWMLPSGGLRRGEDPVATAKRELVEETGCRLYEARVVRILNEDLHGARHCIHVVAGTVSDRAQPDGREVVEARFYALDDLPAETSAGAVETLQTWAGPTGTADAGDMQRP